MCSVPIVFAIASAAMTGVSAVTSAQQQKEIAKFEEKVNRINSEIALQEAADAEKRGEEAERELRLRFINLQGQQRATLAENGILVDFDDALNLLVDTAEQAELEASRVRNNTEREKYAFILQSQNFLNAASMSQVKQKQAGISGVLGVVTAGVSLGVALFPTGTSGTTTTSRSAGTGAKSIAGAGVPSPRLNSARSFFTPELAF